jgi:hypothetical protein
VPPRRRASRSRCSSPRKPSASDSPGHADAVACDGCPALALLFEQYSDAGGELLVCPICFNSRKLDDGLLVANARLAGATPLWDWIGDKPATVFCY